MEKDIKSVPLTEGKYYYCETTTQGKNIFIANPIEEVPVLTMAYVIYGIDDKRLSFNMGVCQDENITLLRPATKSECKRLDDELSYALLGYAKYAKIVFDKKKHSENIIKSIWNGIWATGFFVMSIIKLFNIQDWRDWVIVGMCILLSAIYWGKVEETFMGD